MVTPKQVLLAALLTTTLAFTLFWVIAARRHRPYGRAAPGAKLIAIGFVTNLLDSFGLGSFATTTSIYRLLSLVPDQKIPGTLNAGYALPTLVQALISITIFQVHFNTLVLLTAAAVAGSWVGGAAVSSWPRRRIRIGMALALLAGAILMVMAAVNRVPGGGEELALHGTRQLLAIAINVALGALMALGLALHTPCLIMLSLLGMNPLAAIPLVRGSSALAMPVAGAQFIRREQYDPRAALGLAIGGLLAVVLTARIVESLPLTYVRWLVVVLVVYTAVTMLRSATADASSGSGSAASAF